MKDFIAWIAASLLLAGCMTESGSGHKVPRYTVVVQDTAGMPFSADTVFWYAPPVNGSSVEVGAVCLKADRSEWGIYDSIAGEFYVGARYERPTRDPYCEYGAYDAKPFNSLAFPHVTYLTMEIAESCE